MDVTIKRWVGLGLGTVLATGALTACGRVDERTASREGQIASPLSETTPAIRSTVLEEGSALASASGEGEGGVSIAAAATDPVVYNSALAIVEAHVLAARDAYLVGEPAASGEMFVHPVSEVLFDLQPVLAARGVEDFSELLTAASVAALTGESAEEINARTTRIVAALRAAEKKAPDDGSSQGAVMAGVCADQIERAADMYRVAAKSRAYEPYLDGYGFYKAGQAAFSRGQQAIETRSPEASATIAAALSLLASAYPSAQHPTNLDADQSALTVAASQVVLAVGR